MPGSASPWILTAALLAAALMVAPSMMRTPATGVGPECAVEPPSPSPSVSTTGPAAAASAAVAASLRGSFVENLGQLTDPSILLYATGDGISVGFCRGKVVYHVSCVSGASSDLVVRFEGCAMVPPEGRSPLVGMRSFLLGADGARWRTGARTFCEVLYEGLYPGVDVAYRLEGGTLKYEARLAPGTDPAAISLSYEGALYLALDDATGDLLVGTAAGDLREGAPVSYQPDGAVKLPVESRFVVSGGSEVGFALGPHRTDLPLVIDPGLPFSTYLGGTGTDYCQSVDVDADGNTYLLGYTECADFPSGPSGYDLTLNGKLDAFVAKLSPNGTALLWSTFIGGSNDENSGGIDVDGDGNVYAVGRTDSPDFPTTPGAYDRTQYLNSDAFALKLDPTGTTLVYSTYIGSYYDPDYALLVSVDDDGHAHIAGRTMSGGFPTTAGAYDETFNGRTGTQDTFVLELNATGGSLLYSTYLGGMDEDIPTDLYVDGSGCAYVLGRSNSPNFPTTAGAYSLYNSGAYDVYVTKLAPDGSDLEYSTLIGTYEDESSGSLCPGPGGSMWMVCDLGITFPATPGAFDTTQNGHGDVNLLRLSATGSAVEYSSYLGGSENDFGADLAFDAAGDLCILGTTASTDFPVSELAFSRQKAGGDYSYDCFFVRLDPTLTKIVYSTYLGCSWADYPSDVLIGPGGFAYAGGYTDGGDFPTTLGAYDTAGTTEAFVAKLDIDDPVLVRTDHDPFATTGDTFNVTVGARDNHLVEEVAVEWWQGASPDREWAMGSLVSGTAPEGTWVASLQAPAHSLEPIHFRVRVKDLMGNFIVGPELSVPVYDNDPPTFTEASMGPATTGDLLTLAVDVVDNIGVNVTGALVRYWYGASAAGATVAVMRPASITPIRNGTYDLVVRMPANSTDPLHYVFLANDTSGNAGASEAFTLPVYDNDAPVIVSEDVPDPATTGDPFTVQVRFEDNIGMAMARVTYWFGPSGVQVTRTMRALEVDGRRNGVYDHTIDVPSDSLLDLYLLFTSADAVSNMCFGTVMSVRVVDNDAPTFEPRPIAPPPATGRMVRLLVDVHDNIGVQEVNVTYNPVPSEGVRGIRVAMDPLDVDVRGVGLYAADVQVHDWAVDLRYSFEASDMQGNANATEPLIVLVLDVIAPHLRFQYNASEQLVRGLDRTFHVEVWDNIHILAVYLEYSLVGTVVRENATMVYINGGIYSATLNVPRAFAGTFRAVFSAMDEAGNWNSTGPFEWPTANAAPAVAPLPGWEVVEGVEGTYDLAPYVSDANDPAACLTVTCDLAGVRAEGLVLRLNLSKWQPDNAIVLGVSDGEDTTTARLALHVLNVNDAPVIGRVLPESGARFQEGREVHFLANATDEDGDPLTFTWKEGDRVLGTGDALSVKGLRPGRHEVTLEVSDGNATTRQPLVVIVEEEEGGWTALLLILLIVALVVVALLLVLWRRRAAASGRQGQG